MRRVLLVIGILVLAACSSSHKATPTTSTTSSSSSSTIPSSTSSVPVGPGPVPTTTPATTPTTSGNSTNIRLNGPTGPSNPVECNAQTTLIELSWMVTGAKKIELRIDNGDPYTYPNGARTEMLALTCDGKPHTYKLTATAGGSETSGEITLQSA